MEWAHEFQHKGASLVPYEEFKAWCFKIYGPACTPKFINQRYKRLQQPDILTVLKAHANDDKSDFVTPPFSPYPGTPGIEECHMLGIGPGPNEGWYGIPGLHYKSLWEQDVPYGPALENVTTYNLHRVKDQLQVWLQNGAYRRAYRRAYRQT